MNNFNSETLKETIQEAREAGYVVPRTPTLNIIQTDKVIDAITETAKLDSREEAIILLAILFQKGGTARQCDGNLEAEINNKKLRLKTVRDCMRDAGLAKGERRLARSLATAIHTVCHNFNIPGNLARVILANEISLLTFVTDQDKIWMSDFQNDNEECPERIRQLITNYFKTNKQPQNQKLRTKN